MAHRSRSIIVAALSLLSACAGDDQRQGSGPAGSDPTVPVLAVRRDAVPLRPGPQKPSTTTEPCVALTGADIESGTTGRYGPGLVQHRPEGAACTHARLDGPGNVTVSIFTKEQLDRDIRQDPNLPYTDLRGLLEHSRDLAVSGSSTYRLSADSDLPGYEITSTDPSQTDRLVVIDGDNLVMLAATDPSITLDAVRQWMRLVLSRL